MAYKAKGKISYDGANFKKGDVIPEGRVLDHLKRYGNTFVTEIKEPAPGAETKENSK